MNKFQMKNNSDKDKILKQQDLIKQSFEKIESIKGYQEKPQQSESPSKVPTQKDLQSDDLTKGEADILDIKMKKLEEIIKSIRQEKVKSIGKNKKKLL